MTLAVQIGHIVIPDAKTVATYPLGAPLPPFGGELGARKVVLEKKFCFRI